MAARKVALPKAIQAVIAAHEAGRHDPPTGPYPGKGFQDDCRLCHQERAAAAKVEAPVKGPRRAPAPASTPVDLPDEPVDVVVPVPPAGTDEAASIETREAWMLRGVEKWRPAFEAIGHELPPVRVSIGWPGGRGSRKDVLGQCWAPTAVEDAIPAIFVSPVQSDPVEVLETIGHELIHALNFHWAHRSPFQKVARALGYTNGAVAKTTRKESPDLYAILDQWAAELGPFGHSRVNAGGTDPKGWKLLRPPVQSTRMLKVWCADDGYTLRTTSKWLRLAVPTCPLCGVKMDYEERGGDA
jgi:hypothetical protein